MSSQLCHWGPREMTDKLSAQAHVCSIKQERGVPWSIASKNGWKLLNKPRTYYLSAQLETLEITRKGWVSTWRKTHLKVDTYRLLTVVAEFSCLSLSCFQRPPMTQNHTVLLRRLGWSWAEPHYHPPCYGPNSTGFSMVIDNLGSFWDFCPAMALVLSPTNCHYIPCLPSWPVSPRGSYLSFLKRGRLSFGTAREWQ